MGVMSGTINEIYVEDGKPKAALRVGRATVRVDLLLLMEAKVDDRVLFDSGMALEKIEEDEILPGPAEPDRINKFIA
ncbi:MAG TPA: hypothetical protein VMG34_08435 [Bacteroidota bacterium]|nr:hypothetical protein [Bacteroidota bacterium]